MCPVARKDALAAPLAAGCGLHSEVYRYPQSDHDSATNSPPGRETANWLSVW